MDSYMVSLNSMIVCKINSLSSLVDYSNSLATIKCDNVVDNYSDNSIYY